MIKNNRIDELYEKTVVTPISKVRVWDTTSISKYFDSVGQINEISNPSFENWTGTDPDSWSFRYDTPVEEVDGIEYEKVTDSKYGSYALRMYVDYPTWDEETHTWDEADWTWNEYGAGQAEMHQRFDHSEQVIYFGASVKGCGYIGIVAYDIDDNPIEDYVVAFNTDEYSNLNYIYEVSTTEVAYFEIICGIATGCTDAHFDGVYVSEADAYKFENFNTASYDEFEVESVNISSDVNNDTSVDFSVLETNSTVFNQSGFGIINKHRIVEVFIGFYDDEFGVDRYIRRFVGFIESAERSSDNTIKVFCIDFSFVFKSTINENYPNYDSYMDMPLDNGFIQYIDSIKEENYVPAYDGWLLENVIRDLCIKAGFPIDNANIFESNVRLDIGVDNYPYRSVDGEGSYAYQYGYGQTVWEIIKDVANRFGYTVYFDNNGVFNFTTNGFWEFHKPEEMIHTNEFDFNSDDFSYNNPTWTYISNFSNPGSGEVAIEDVDGKNMRLYTLGDKSDGVMSITMYYPSGDDYITESLGEFDVKGLLNDGAIINANYIDAFANTDKYIGGKMLITVNSGYVAFAGYGYNNDELSYVQKTFTDDFEITQENLKLSVNDMVNDVTVIGQSKSGRQIAVRAFDEWSIYGGRYLTENDMDVVSNNLSSTEIGALFDKDTSTTVNIPDDTYVDVSFYSNQLISKIEMLFKMKFGDKAKYQIIDKDTDDIIYSSALSNIYEDSMNVFESSKSYNTPFFIAKLTSAKMFICAYDAYYILTESGVEKGTLDTTKPIIDADNYGGYVFLMTDEKVYRYNGTSVEEFCDLDLTVDEKKQVHSIKATSNTEALIFGGYKTSDFFLEKTVYLGVADRLVNFFSGISNFGTVFAKQQPSNNKPINYDQSNNRIVLVGRSFSTYSVGFFTRKYRIVVMYGGDDVSSVGTELTPTISMGKMEDIFIITAYGNHVILVNSSLYVCPDITSSTSWEQKVLNDRNKDHHTMYVIDNELYVFGTTKRVPSHWSHTTKLFTSLYKVNGFYEQELIDNQNRLMYTDVDINGSFYLKNKINGLYYGFKYADFEETKRSGKLIDVESNIQNIRFYFEEGIGDVVIKDIGIYSRAIKNNLDILPATYYSFEGKSRPAYGSYDSLVGNVSDKTLPYYNYKTIDLPPNYIGRKKSFVIEDGRLNNKALCAWLAQTSLYKYRKNFFEYSASVIAYPLVDIYDCIQFQSDANNIDDESYFWVEGYKLNWGSNPSLDLTVNSIKPYSGFQNYISLSTQYDKVLNNIKIAATNKDDISDSTDLPGSFVATGINEYTFAYDTESDKIIDPFYKGLGFGFAVARNCNVIISIQDSNKNVQKIIKTEGYRAGDLFDNFEDFLLYDGVGSRSVSDAGDFELYLEEGDYTATIQVYGSYNRDRNLEKYIIPFTVEYEYVYAGYIESAEYDNTTGDITIATKTKRRLATGGSYSDFDNSRTFLLFQPNLYVIDDGEKEDPVLIESLDWFNDNNLFRISLLGQNIPSGYKPIIVLSNIKDRGGRPAIELSENTKEFDLVDLFDYPFSTDKIAVSHLKTKTGDWLGHRYYYIIAAVASRSFKPFDIAEGELDPQKISVTKNGSEICNGTSNWAATVDFRNNKLAFDGSGQNLYYVLNHGASNFGKGARGGDWNGHIAASNTYFYNTFIDTSDEWKVIYYELDYFTNVTGWA